MATIGTAAFLVAIGVPFALLVIARFNMRGPSEANDRERYALNGP
ncbi:hypothetical protein [Bradyrhizobium pachyrhizi]|nr:hypothetical protein [Bradyrhizobium pachyrhizi]